MSDYKTLKELSADQITELKQSYLCHIKMKGKGVSYGELAAADELVSNEELEEEYGSTPFTDDDFFCTADI